MDSIPVAREKDILKQELNDEVLLYDLKTNQAYNLNNTSAAVWRSCSGKSSPQQIADDNKIPIEMVMYALDDLHSMNLLERGDLKDQEDKAASRRAIIKMGLVLGIGAPLITSLLAPSAMMAASGQVCGDGVRTGAETCDDGNIKVGDGCSNSCTVEPGYACPTDDQPCVRTFSRNTCGDGTRSGSEACDDGNTASGDGCSGGCTIEAGYF